MEVLRFTLSGKSACFRKPEVNSYCYFTYGNIHKVALLGLFGAILGYGGYTQMRKLENEKTKAKASDKISEGYPEFYERLMDLKISILPLHEKGLIPKKIQAFNNSVGYASKEQGGNLIVKEQWLESPRWEICVLMDSQEAYALKNEILSGRCVYAPYLGKNDHPADITKAAAENIEQADFQMGRLACLSPVEKVQIADLDFDEQEELDAFCTFKYQEALPYGMDKWTNHYLYQTFLYTDAFVEVRDTAVYQLGDGKKIIFY